MIGRPPRSTRPGPLFPSPTVFRSVRAQPEVPVALCLPATLIDVAVARAPDLMIGAQDCHAERDGAYTGCVSASLLRAAGASIVLVGHSERRPQIGRRPCRDRVWQYVWVSVLRDLRNTKYTKY